MVTVDAILSEVDKLQPNEKLRLLHQLVDKILATPGPDLDSRINFDKYLGIGKDVWETDAQIYIDEIRDEERV